MSDFPTPEDRRVLALANQTMIKRMKGGTPSRDLAIAQLSVLRALDKCEEVLLAIDDILESGGKNALLEILDQIKPLMDKLSPSRLAQSDRAPGFEPGGSEFESQDAIQTGCNHHCSHCGVNVVDHARLRPRCECIVCKDCLR